MRLFKSTWFRELLVIPVYWLDICAMSSWFGSFFLLEAFFEFVAMVEVWVPTGFGTGFICWILYKVACCLWTTFGRALPSVAAVVAAELLRGSGTAVWGDMLDLRG